MPEFIVDNLRTDYASIVRVVRKAPLVKVRGKLTAEILGVNIVIHDPSDVLPVGVGRKLHSAIGAVEALQLIAGESHPELMCKVSSNFREFMDGGTFHGAYGPRIRHQYHDCLNRLTFDPSTRQALMTIWDPALDNQAAMHDYPCTTSLQFLIRNDKLDMQVYMRSNDVWRGLAYDAFQFTQLQHNMASALELPLGVYRHYAASLHMYATDFEAADEMLAEPTLRTSAPIHRPRGVTIGEARCLLATGKAGGKVHTQWYEDTLARYFA